MKIPRPEGAKYGIRDILSVLVYAAAHQTTIEHASAALENAPSSNTVRGATGNLKIEVLEERLNQSLADSLEIAIDLKLAPYWEEAKEGEEDFLLSGPGTTTFFGYASVYTIKKNKRFILALTVIRRSEGLVPALDRLLICFSSLGGKIHCLYLDTMEVLRFLIQQRDIPSAMAAPKKGKERKIKGLIRQKGVGVHPCPKNGQINVQVAVKYIQGRWGRHGRKRYAFVIHRYPFCLEGLFGKYRHRFGIESSHRIWEKARARTASQKAALRLLLVGIAIILHNLWVFLLWTAVSIPSQGGRKVLRKLFRFQRLLSSSSTPLNAFISLSRRWSSMTNHFHCDVLRLPVFCFKKGKWEHEGRRGI